MSSNIILIGADDVSRGGSMILSAAQDMKQAANTIDFVVTRLERVLGDFIGRFEAAVKAGKEG